MAVRSVVIGLFGSPKQVQQAVDIINQKGLGNNQVSVVSPTDGHIPWQGLMVQGADLRQDHGSTLSVAGPLAGAIQQPDKDLSQSLKYYGIPEHRATFYGDAVSRQNKTLLLVETNNERAGMVMNVFQDYGGKDVERWGSGGKGFFRPRD